MGERGITGLETAIVLIAFVVVSSVFAFAALTTGLFSSDQSKATIQAGLSEARGSLEVWGGVQAESTVTTKSLTTVTGEAVGTGNGVNTSFSLANSPILTNSETVYVAAVAKTRDTDYTINFGTAAITFTAAPANGAAVTADYKHGNEAVGTGNGTTTSFTLASKPVMSGSVTLYEDGVVKTFGADYDVTYGTGVLTLTSAPANGKRIDAIYQYYKIDKVKFHMANAAGGKPVDVTPGETVLAYTDSDTLDENIDDFVITPQGSADADNLLEPGEIIESTVDVSSYGLKEEEEFLIEVRPPDGAVIGLGRSIPATISAIINLD